MRLLRSFVIGVMLMGVMPFYIHAQLIINEFMQSNIDCVFDDINEFPDSWVELYNQGNTSVNLNEYKIGITSVADYSWSLPSQQVPAKGYVVIYCDKEAKGLHTDFRLETGKGGALYLFKKATLVDYLANIPAQLSPNIAFGRKNDGSGEWGFMAIPTPKSSNCGNICTKILGEPIFSQSGRVFSKNEQITLSLSIPQGSPEGTVIRVTYDGSEPTSSSSVYSSPLTISSSTIVKAKLFCNGYLSPMSTTHSYLFHKRSVTLPVISLTADPDYFYDNKIGIYVDGNYKSDQKNYKFDWRRPVTIEMFEGENMESCINQLCETRVQGGASRDFMLKSLIIYAHKRFGKKRLKYEFFPDQRPGITDFKSIILRNAGNDFDYLYMRDAIIQRVMATHTDLDWQAWRPAIIYINGVYKGMLNIRERSTGDNIYTNYDGLEDIDMIENWNSVKEGDKKNFDQFTTFYSEHGHTLKEYEQWIDWQEFINLMVMNLFFNNQDFPGNNIVMWRPRSENGIWRFVAKDTDFGLGLYDSPSNYHSIEWLYNPDYDGSRNWANQYQHTRLFRRMMEDADFKREFIDRSAIYMGDFMNPAGTREIWDSMYEMIRIEYPNHRRLINQWWPNYTTELNKARKWLEERCDHFYNELSNYYQLGKPVRLTVNLNVEDDNIEAVDLFMNGVRLTHSSFNGRFFADRPLTISSLPIKGRRIIRWRVETISQNGNKTTQEYDGPSFSFSMPNCQVANVIAEYDDDTGIDSTLAHHWKWRKDGDRLTLQQLPIGMRVDLYNTNGILLFSSIASGEDMQLPIHPRSIHILKVGNQVVKIR